MPKLPFSQRFVTDLQPAENVIDLIVRRIIQKPRQQSLDVRPFSRLRFTQPCSPCNKDTLSAHLLQPSGMASQRPGIEHVPGTLNVNKPLLDSRQFAAFAVVR